VFLIDEVLEGGERLVRFEWAKTRFGAKLPPVYLRRQKTGFFEEVDSPAIKRDETERQVDAALRAAWTQGLRREDVMELLGVKADSARRVLARLNAKASGSTRQRRYFHPDCLAELDPNLPFDEEEPVSMEAAFGVPEEG